MKNNKGISKFQIIVLLAAAAICVAMGMYSNAERSEDSNDTAIVGDAETGNVTEAAATGEIGTEPAVADTVTVQTEQNPPAITQTEQTQPGVLQTGQTDAAWAEPATTPQSSLFYFDMLSDEEKQVYGEVYVSIVSREEKKLSTLDTQLVDKLYQFVLWDHPEIFYSNGYNLQQQLLNGQIIRLTLEPVYQMSETEVANNQAFIDSYMEKFRAALPQGLDTYGKIKFVYEYLINGTEYELGCENSQNICSVFILHKSVCAGYTKATQYLLGELGIPATVVHGSVSGEGHAWNLVWADGVPYYLDTTWGDASYTFSTETEEKRADKIPPVSYDYFLITEQELLTTHRIDHPEYYPAVTATEYNYYRHEGLFFESYDTAKLSEAFDRAYAAGQQSLTIRCASQGLLLEMKDSLLTQQKIFDYVQVNDRFYYNINDSMCTMTFWLE